MSRLLLLAAVALLAACGDDATTPPPCVPACDGLACGPDPVCGTDCGACGDGLACADHACADVDECVAGVGGQPACGPGTACSNTDGGFDCACLPTFTGDPRAPAGCAPTFALEQLGGGVWYGFRQLRAAYAGAALTAALAAGDRRDIGFDHALLDTAALDDFAAGADTFVATLYDQSGTHRDAAQAARVAAPTLVDAAGRRAMAFSKVQGLVSPGALAVFDRATAFTVFMPVAWNGDADPDPADLLTVGRSAPDTGDWPFTMQLLPTTAENLAGRGQVQLQTTAGEYHLDAEGTVGRAGAFEIHEAVFDATTGFAYYNNGRLVGQAAFTGGAPLVAVPAGVPADRSVTIGNQLALDRGLGGKAFPPIVFDRALSAAERATVREELAAYYGIELPAPRPPAGDEYTIVLVPDTQRFAEQTNGLQAQVITNLVQWVIANRTTWNIQMVTQVGDIVNNTQAIQYQRAMAWYQLLDAAGMPYCVAIGNHDYANLATRDSSLYDSYFTQAHYTGLPWWSGGFFEANKTDNLWFIAPLAGQPTLFLTMEYQPRQEVVDWANALLTANADKKAIIVTHDFMTQTGAFSTVRAIATNSNVGEELYAKLVSRHTNIFLVLNGHFTRGGAYRHDRTTGANYIYFDPMFLDGVNSPETWGNDGYAQLLVVSPSKHTIRVMTYSPNLSANRTDAKALFTLDF